MKSNLSENESKVLEYLINNPGLTTMIAVTVLKILNVQDVIMRLRDYGYDIPNIEWRSSPSKKRYGVYKLII